MLCTGNDRRNKSGELTHIALWTEDCTDTTFERGQYWFLSPSSSKRLQDIAATQESDTQAFA